MSLSKSTIKCCPSRNVFRSANSVLYIHQLSSNHNSKVKQSQLLHGVSISEDYYLRGAQ